MQVLPAVLTAEEVSALRDALSDAPFENGKLTATGLAARAKNNLQLKRDQQQATPLDEIVLTALSRHPLFHAWAIPKRVAMPTFSRYDVGMAYGAHVDASLIGTGQPLRSDISITIFISDPKDYDGGELAIETSGGTRNIKLPAGDAIAYPTFALHQVLPVTRGQRLVAVTWVQSLVRDAAMRQVLFDLNAASRSLLEQSPDAAESRLVHKAYNNLMRLVIDA